MNISLIGMMGSGKTTIAKLLAEKLKTYTFIDTDELIVQQENCSINDIFALKGENSFRNIESRVLKSVLENDNLIISTGGGIVKSEENISILKDKSVVFYLKADTETLYNRTKNNNERPLLNCSDMYNRIELLLTKRESCYQQAHFTIDTVLKEPEKIVDEIIEELKNYDKCRS